MDKNSNHDSITLSPENLTLPQANAVAAPKVALYSRSESTITVLGNRMVSKLKFEPGLNLSRGLKGCKARSLSRAQKAQIDTASLSFYGEFIQKHGSDLIRRCEAISLRP